MRYADYTYYVETYGGSMIPERDFQYYAARASEYIDQQTFDRLTKGVPQEFADKVSSCCCEAAEKLYCFSASASGGGTGSDVSSEKNRSVQRYLSFGCRYYFIYAERQ